MLATFALMCFSRVVQIRIFVKDKHNPNVGKTSQPFQRIGRYAFVELNVPTCAGSKTTLAWRASALTKAGTESAHGRKVVGGRVGVVGGLVLWWLLSLVSPLLFIVVAETQVEDQGCDDGGE